MSTAAAIAFVWTVIFLVLLFPARWVGNWVNLNAPNLFFGFLFCIAITKLVIVWIGVVLVFGRFSFLPHFNADPKGLGLIFLALLLAVPVFAAVTTGYLRARKRALEQTAVI